MTAEDLRKALEKVTALFDEKNHAFASLEERSLQANKESAAELAELKSALNETQVVAAEFQQKLNGEISLRTQEQERGEMLTSALLDKENEIYALQDVLSSVVADSERLERALTIAQETLSENASSLNEFALSTQSLQERLDNEMEHRNHIAKALAEKQEHAFAIEETLTALTADKDSLEQALHSAQMTVVEKSSALITLQEEASILGNNLLIEKEQHALLAEKLKDNETRMVTLEEALVALKSTKEELGHALVDAQTAIAEQTLALK